MTCTTPTFLQDIVTGFGTFLTWIAILAIPTTAMMVGYHALTRNADPDPMSAAQHQRKMVASLMGGGIAVLAGVAVPAIITAIDPNTCAPAAGAVAALTNTVMAAAVRHLPSYL